MSGEIKQFKTFRDLGKISKDNSTGNIGDTTAATSTSSITSTPSKSRTTSRPNTSQDVSPTRDYQKVPNSLTREAVPSGMFKGKSKLVYDYLWSESRGAIIPTREINKSRKEIMKKTAIGSMVTVDAALNHLQSVGLIRIIKSIGSLQGNQYEILAPDEVSATSTTSISSSTSPTQKLDDLDVLETSISSITQTIDNTIPYSVSKTLFKDIENIDDDSPIFEAFRLLSEAAKRTNGKGLNKSDWKAFLTLINIFVDETDLAVARSKTVSSYVALGTENLSRRLYSKKQAKPKLKDWKTVGSTKPENSVVETVEPLSDSLKETVLNSLRSVEKQNGKEAVEVFKSNYTTEDWDWLMNKLNK